MEEEIISWPTYDSSLAVAAAEGDRDREIGHWDEEDEDEGQRNGCLSLRTDSTS